MNVSVHMVALGTGTARLVRSTIGKTALVQTAEKLDTRVKNKKRHRANCPVSSLTVNRYLL